MWVRPICPSDNDNGNELDLYGKENNTFDKSACLREADFFWMDALYIFSIFPTVTSFVIAQSHLQMF